MFSQRLLLKALQALVRSSANAGKQGTRKLKAPSYHHEPPTGATRHSTQAQRLHTEAPVKRASLTPGGANRGSLDNCRRNRLLMPAQPDACDTLNGIVFSDAALARTWG